MRQIPTTREFEKTTGTIEAIEALKALGLTPCCVMGSFCRDHCDQLFEFCEKNPDFHLVSCTSNGLFNKFLPRAHSIYLAEGDPNPNLIHLFSLDVQQFSAELKDLRKRRAAGSR